MRDELRDGRAAGGWLGTGSPTVAELLADAGFDFIIVDTEHTPASIETVEASIRAIEATAPDVAPIVRVPDNDPARIKRVLDLGPAGLMCPRIDTPEAAAALVDASTYPPAGQRGMAASRASRYGREIETYYREADTSLLRIAQIETETAVGNAGAIAATDGIDSLLIGPADLSAGLGVFGEYEGDRFREAVRSVVQASGDVPVGTLATPPMDPEEWLALGFDYLILGTDQGYVQAGADRWLDAYESSDPAP